MQVRDAYRWTSRGSEVFCRQCGGSGRSVYASKNKLHLSDTLYSYDWLYDEYINKQRSAEDIAKEFGKTKSAICAHIHRMGIKRDSFPYRDVFTEDLLHELYCVRSLSASKISDMYEGSSIGGILNLVDEYGFEKHTALSGLKVWLDDDSNRAIISDRSKQLWLMDSYRSKHQEKYSDPDWLAEQSIRQSARYQGVSVDMWRGYMTEENKRVRNSNEYAKWRNAVFAKDEYTCQCCGARGGTGHSVVLNAHHIRSFSEYPDLRFDVNNGITLCESCHAPQFRGSLHNTLGTKNVTPEQLYKFIDEHQAQTA